ncbi:MAG: four helix bundle protein [Acidobacteria bacterium]|nr:four helix bundle protein [Acidobacteriota bacterium]
MKNPALGAAVVATAAPQIWADELGQRVYAFALRAIKLTDRLPEKRAASRILGSQLVRSATSVAANYEEARGAVSRPDFVFKLSLAYKECRESVLWLCLIRDAEIVRPTRMAAIIAEALELRAIFGTSLKTARQRRRTT